MHTVKLVFFCFIFSSSLFAQSSISGQISSSVTGPLGTGEGRARLYSPDGAQVAIAETDDTGAYILIDVAPGTYYVVLTPRNANLIDELYDGGSGVYCPRLSCDSGQGLQIVVNENDEISGIDGTLDPGSRISGNISLDGNPLDSGLLYVYSDTGVHAGLGWFPDVNGDYSSSSGFPAGSYYVSNRPQSGNPANSDYVPMVYSNHSCGEPCDVTLGDLVTVNGVDDVGGIDFELRINTSISGQISSSVTGPLGTREGRARLYSPDGAQVAIAETDDTGAYILSDVAPGTYYVVLTPRNANLIDELYDGGSGVYCPRFTCDSSQGLQIVVNAGDEITGIDGTLDPGSRISGNISLDGNPLDSVLLYVYSDTGVHAGLGWFTDVNGDYSSSSGFPAGSYYVSNRPQSGNPTNSEYVPLVYPNKSCGEPCDVTLGDLVAVNGADDVGGIDFEFRFKADWGDAPLHNTDTFHELRSDLKLGQSADAETMAQVPNLEATGDDNDGSDDEDGVFFKSALIKGQTTFVDIAASGPGLLNAWADFGNGWDDPGEQIFTDQPLVAGINSLSFAVPDTGADNENAALRFRFSTQGGLGPEGPADDGEVEDYVLVRRASSDPDPDNDGVEASVEDAGPNGGDGNNDGIADSVQLNVTSIPSAGDGEYIVTQSEPGTALTHVAAVDPDSLGEPPSVAAFPVGALEFQVEGMAPGASAQVVILLPAGVEVDSYFKFGDEPEVSGDHWYEFLDDGTTGAVLLPGRIVLKLVDGGRGDDDVTANGVIVDPGAAALGEVIFADGLEDQPAPPD